MTAQRHVSAIFENKSLAKMANKSLLGSIFLRIAA
jgi:hypothetical protein